MRLSKRSITLLVCLLTAVTLTVTGTIAYLTDTAAVTNTFTVGKVQIKLDETVVNTDGTPVVDDMGKQQRTEEGNNYHLIPGKSYVKDPMTTVLVNSEESYVRMIVTIKNFAELNAAFTAHGQVFNAGDWVTDYDATKWVKQGEATWLNTSDLALEYRYYTTVNTMGTTDLVLEPLFTAFTVPGFLTGAEMATLEDMVIDVRAEAIQAEGFHGSADEAWTAFEAAQTPATQSEAEVQPEEGVIPAEDDMSDATI